MNKIAISTDTNSGLTQKLAEEHGVFVLPMTFTINDQVCVEGKTIKHKDFFRLQADGAKIFTSQPAPGDVMDHWDAILEDYETIIHIPMSSGLSGSYSTARMLAEDYDGRVVVIDNGRVSATLLQSVLDAKAMADHGASVEEIQTYLTSTAADATIYVAVDNLRYLKEGGRLSPAAASLATILNIKPVLYVGSGNVEAFAKCRGMKGAKKKMIEALEVAMKEVFHTEDINDLNLHAATSLGTEDALEWKAALEEHFGVPCSLDRLPLSLATHVGFGAIGAGFTRKMK